MSRGRLAGIDVENAGDPRPRFLYSARLIVVQEIEIGVLLRERTDPAQGAHLRGWLEERVLPAFAGRILPVTLEVARHGAALHVPDPRPARDGLIAATALAHGLGVATRNVRDFEGTGIRLTNPWEDAED